MCLRYRKKEKQIIWNKLSIKRIYNIFNKRYIGLKSIFPAKLQKDKGIIIIIIISRCQVSSIFVLYLLSNDKLHDL